MVGTEYQLCNGCGEKNELKEAFCSECFGTDFTIKSTVIKKEIQLDIVIEKDDKLSTSEFKICKNCGIKNKLEEFMCISCLQSDFTNNDTELDTNHKSNKTTIEIRTKQLELHGKNINQKINSNDIVGRSALLSDFLSEYTKVSREHAKFYIEDNRWYVEDLNSTNGTYINDMKIIPQQKREIFNNDSLKFSTTFNIKVLLK